MAYPDKYTRGYGFASYQESHPQSPLPGSQVDVEFDAAAKSTAAITAFLQKFARSDGRLANGSVGVDQLAPDLSIGFKAPTTWEPSVLYSLGATVFYLSGFYNCTTAHTSGSSFNPDYWDLILDFGSSANAAAASAAVAAASETAAAGSASSADADASTATTKASEASASAATASEKADIAVAAESAVSLLGPTRVIMAGNYATPALADAAAVAGQGIVYLDKNFTLTEDTTLAAKWVGTGGAITLGDYDLDMGGTAFSAPIAPVFITTGTGKVVGDMIAPILHPEWWEANATDDATVALQRVYDFIAQAGTPHTVQLNAMYKTSDTVTINPYSPTRGDRARTGITNSHATNYALEYLTGDTGPVEINTSLVLEDFKIVSKNGIRLGDNTLPDSDFVDGDSQTGYIKQVRITGLFISGAYDPDDDADASTDTVPDLDDLLDFGVGISCTKVFDAVISACQIQFFGVGIRLDGSDLNSVRDSRINLCARWVHLNARNTFGGQNRLEHLDLLRNYRYAGIYIDANPSTTIEDSFFESLTASATYIATRGDMGTLIDGNRFGNPGVAGVKYLSLAPQYGMIVSHNRAQISVPVAGVEVSSIYCDFSAISLQDNFLVKFLGNEGAFNPEPKFPYCVYEWNDPRKFDPFNPKVIDGGVVAGGAFPFAVSTTTGRYRLVTSPIVASIDFPTFPTDDKFLVRLSGVQVEDQGFINITWGGNAAYNNYAFFADVDGLQVVEITITRPAGSLPDSGLTFQLVNNQVEYHGIELIPVSAA